MISDFNSLKWQDVKAGNLEAGDLGDLEILKGAYIDDLETIWAGYADDNGNMVIDGLVLYITDRNGKKIAVTLEAPEFEQLQIKQANLLEGVEA